MSTSHLFMPAGFPQTNLHNGVGRWICQLQRITFKFCKNHNSSIGMREFLEMDLLDFAKNNSGIVVYVKPRRHRTPNITAEYLNGERQMVNCRHYTRPEIIKWVSLLRTHSGTGIMRMYKMWHTDHPSIQGPWNPFLNRDPQVNTMQFPNEEKSKPVYIPKSATEELIKMFQEQQKSASSN